MRSTMQDFPLTIGAILRHGVDVHGDGEVVTATDGSVRSQTYAELGVRVSRLANALRSLGVSGDDRVGTFQWNNAEHLEAYLAIPSMGSVLHTLNIRLFPDQLTYIANHAEDKVVIVDGSLVDLLAKQLPKFDSVQHVLVAGPDAKSANLDALRESGKEVNLYDDLLDAADDTFDWPRIDERDAAAMCYTSGTTGNPKGVVYSHRSTLLHTLITLTADFLALSERDVVLPVVPMFHA
ncbi:MAG: AMP-binding protein, partial [Nocardioidaceae bacterium]